jgi:glycosyltransferase involved in cell wall biosynthesis
MSLAGGVGILYNIFLLLLSRILLYRIFLHHHSYAYIDRRSLFMDLLIRLGGRETMHICLCPGMAGKLRNIYPNVGEVTVLSNAALMPRVIPSQHPREAIIRLGHLGNLFLEKGLDKVIDLFRAVCREGIEGRLVLAGPVPTQESATLINAAIDEFGEGFDYRGAVYGEAKESFFRDIDVFIFPSRYVHETQPLVIFEAMSSGVPVISYSRGCIGDDLSESGGLGIPPGSDFVAATLPIIREWAENRAKLERSSSAAFEKAERLREGAQADLHRLVNLIAVPGS